MKTCSKLKSSKNVLLTYYFPAQKVLLFFRSYLKILIQFQKFLEFLGLQYQVSYKPVSYKKTCIQERRGHPKILRKKIRCCYFSYRDGPWCFMNKVPLKCCTPPPKKKFEMLSNFSELTNLIQLKVYALPILDLDGRISQKNICPQKIYVMIFLPPCLRGCQGSDQIPALLLGWAREITCFYILITSIFILKYITLIILLFRFSYS